MRRGWILLTLLSSACRQDLGLDELVFACASAQDCARGTVCDEGLRVCRGPGQDASVVGLLVPDAGTDDRGRLDGSDADVGAADLGPDGGLHLRAVAAGREHTCALEEGGTIQCWGQNDRGQLGYGSLGGNSVRPVRVLHFTDFIEVGAGNRHTCGLRAGGDVHCWGSNGLGEAGFTSNTDQPGSIPLFSGVVELAVGQYQTTCARRSGTDVRCVGFVIDGQTWAGEDGGRSGPFAPAGFHGAIARLSVGHQFMCALLEPGGLDCFGGGAHGGGFSTATSTPALVPGLSEVTSAAAASGHACAVRQSEVYCWGKTEAAFGYSGTPRESPVPMNLGAPAASVSVGWGHSCALMADETVRCWGRNDQGQLGAPIAPLRRPGVVPGLTGVRALAVGNSHSCALTRDQQLYCWGENSQGQLGRDTGGASDPNPAAVEW